MVSSGIRIGAWDYLKWKHITPVVKKENNEVIAARLIVYAGDSEEYYTFITPEAYSSLKEWTDFRKDYGERITGESWVMRDLWQTTNIKYGVKLGLATCPKKLKSSGIKRLLERALWEQGLRQPLSAGVSHEWKAAHGFRKYYKSRAEQTMRPINVEITMGHNIGISASYYRPTEQEVLEDYSKAIDLLTINGDKAVLQKQVNELKEKSNDSEYIVKAKLEEKDRQLHDMSQKYDSDIALLKEAISDMQELLKNPGKLSEISKASNQLNV